MVGSVFCVLVVVVYRYRCSSACLKKRKKRTVVLRCLCIVRLENKVFLYSDLRITVLTTQGSIPGGGRVGC